MKLNVRKRVEEGGWRLALLDNALLAVVPIDAREGDEVVVLRGRGFRLC